MMLLLLCNLEVHAVQTVQAAICVVIGQIKPDSG